jgi:hypothetical protein
MATINTIFKQVFGEALKSRGFVKVKGRQPYLVRVVGNEILHVVAFKNEWCGEPGYKEFGVYGGVGTVYRKIFDFSCGVRDNISWLCNLRDYYTKSNPADFDDYWKELTFFRFQMDNEESLYRKMKHALKETERIMLPVLDQVSDLDACIEFLRVYNSTSLYMSKYNEDYTFGYEDDNEDCNESLLYIQTDNHDNLVQKFNELLAVTAKAIENGKSGYRPYEIEKKAYEEWRVRTVTRRDNIYNTPKLYEKIMEELERRKKANTETLRSYGIDL